MNETAPRLDKDIVLRPIGRVKKEGDRVSIQVEEDIWPATLNVDEFSHLIVLWWITGQDNEEGRSVLRVTPKASGAVDPEESGVFACRSPVRPNPIGLSIVRFVELRHESREIVIDRIDAFDETPVVDIKPYMPSSDRVGSTVVPEWFEDLEYHYP